MRFKKTSYAVAVLALLGAMPAHTLAQSLPAPTSGTLEAWFKAPLGGQTVSGVLSLDKCYVKGYSVARVNFFLDGTALNSDTNVGDGMSCVLDTRRFSNGTHELRAVAYDSSGRSYTERVSINIQNSATQPANTPPTVSITSPSANQSVSGSLTYAANATDNAGVSRVEFKLDGSVVNNDTSAPYGGSVGNLAPGSHTLTATAFDAAGLSSTSSVTFTVPQANTAPTVSITSPAANQSITGSTLSYAANAADNAGVSRVEFRLDGTLLASDTSSPYGGSIAAPAPGTHTLTATAFDAAGLSSASSVTFTVPQPTTSTPTTALPAPTSGTLDAWFKAPLGGQTVSGLLSLDKCYVKGTGVARVSFFLDSTALNSDTNVGDGMSCVLDTTKFANGTHQLKATAYDSSGRAYNEIISINIQNSATTPPPTGSNTPPTVAITSPTANQTLSGNSLTYTANASDANGVSKVEFRLDGTLISTDTTNSYGGTASNLSAGTHTLTATAFDTAGASSSSTVTFTVPGSSTTPPPTSSLPSTGVRATPTFHSIGLYWASPSGAGSSGCNVQYRAAGESAWKQGHAMWYDSRNSECRGSLVHLTPGTNYEVQMGVAGQQMSRGIVAKTWSEEFPIARTVHVQPGTTLNITQGGTKDGYVLYTPAPGTSGVLDARNGQDHNVRISAPYVIVRGFTLRGATMDAVRMYPGARDVVIENNNISGWGRTRDGGTYGVDGDSAVRARCDSTFQLERTVVQNNTIHTPRYGANSWSSGHPAGPQAINYWACGANHVFRYNKITSTSGHYYNDAIGGGSNFSSVGFPFADTDIYGNHIANAMDDGIEAEGGNRNVRIWGNYIDDTYITIASTATHVGPLYVFRNISGKTGTFGKSGQKSGYGEGRRYFFHNTILQVSGGAGSGIKGNTNEPMTNSISRNNMWHMSSSNSMAIGMIGGSANNFDYDMSNGNMRPYSGAQPNGIAGTPTYASGHGPASGVGGYYQLAPGSRGYDAGVVLPNFNDNFTGAKPDLGAHEAGAGQMKFGPR